MSVARLTADLLARKGAALPIANVYGNPMLDPLPVRREAPGRRRLSAAPLTRCRIAPELHTQLRILAARRGQAMRTLLEAAVTDYLAAEGQECPCLRAGTYGSADRQTINGCCQGQ